MQFKRLSTGIFLVALLAAVGFLMVYLPPQIIAQYKTVAEMGPVWVYVYFAVVGAGALLLAVASGYIVWSVWSAGRRKQSRRRQLAKSPSQLSTAERREEIDQNLRAVEDLQSDPAVSEEVKQQLTQQIKRISRKHESQQLEIAAFGTISSGKSSVLNALAGRDVFRTDAKGGTTTRRGEIPWTGSDKVTLVDTPGLGEIDGESHLRLAAEAARDADIVLMVVDGPLRESEFQLLSKLGEMEKHVLVCLNKGDLFEESDQKSLLAQLTAQLKSKVDPRNILTVSASPAERTRIRVTADGREIEEQVACSADISRLAERMMKIVQRDGRDLLLANLLLQSRGLIEESQRKVRESLDRRAREIVDRYTWSAGGAAALSPLPLLDLIAGGAISTKMVLDLARVYRQEVDVDTIVNLLGQLGKNLIGVLGVTAATPAVAAGVGSLLKTVPGAGTIAGGFLQGIVQALITRWIGAVFVEYFKNEMQAPPGGLAALARQQWEHLTSPEQLRKLVAAARRNLRPAGADKESCDP